MIHIITILITIIVVVVKVILDIKNWGNVDHTKGIVLVSAILIPLSIVVKSLYPLFLFATLFNPVLNVSKGLPFFYIGKTSEVDKFLREIFKDLAGEAFMLLMFLAFIYTFYASIFG